MSTIRMKLELEQIGYGILYSKSLTLAEDEHAWISYEVADGITAQAIPFNFTTGVTTTDILFVTSSYQITYYLNGSATANTLDANGVHAYFGTNVTAMTVTNASGSTAIVKILVAGT